MQETPTDQIVDDATPVLHECGRTFDVIDIGAGKNINHERKILYLLIEWHQIVDGTSILGSSNMCTRYWAGILSVYRSPNDLADQTNCYSSMEFEGGLSCAKFVSGSKVIYNLII